MGSSHILALYVGCVLLEQAVETLLVRLNIAHVRKHSRAVPGIFRGAVDDAAYRRSAAYALARSRFSMVSGPSVSLGIGIAAAGGVFGGLEAFLSAHINNPTVLGILFVYCVGFFIKLLSLPFALYSQFVIEARHGFNRMTPGLFARDSIKALVLTAVLLLPLLWAVLSLMDQGPWLIFFCTAFFHLCISLLHPLFIAPLFNRFRPLQDGALNDRLQALARELGFPVRGIFVMDGSRRSRHSNAYVTGFGRSRRIVLYDTLIEALNHEQIAAVLAHEIGHARKRHLARAQGATLVFILIVVHLLGVLYHHGPLYAAFGFGRPSAHALVVILGLCGGPILFFLTPLFSAFSRSHEYAADRFAARAAGLGRELAEALLALGRNNLANLAPHPCYSFFHYSHPALAERLKALEAFPPPA